MDVALLVAGVLLLFWPIQYRRSMRRIESRMAARGGDPETFRQHMDRRWIRIALMAAPFAGVALIALGLIN
jgi:hypothetical protein